MCVGGCGWTWRFQLRQKTHRPGDGAARSIAPGSVEDVLERKPEELGLGSSRVKAMPRGFVTKSRRPVAGPQSTVTKWLQVRRESPEMQQESTMAT